MPSWLTELGFQNGATFSVAQTAQKLVLVLPENAVPIEAGFKVSGQVQLFGLPVTMSMLPSLPAAFSSVIKTATSGAAPPPAMGLIAAPAAADLPSLGLSCKFLPIRIGSGVVQLSASQPLLGPELSVQATMSPLSFRYFASWRDL